MTDFEIPPPLEIESELGFLDVKLTAWGRNPNPAGDYYELTIAASREGRPLGFNLLFSRTWEETIFDEQNPWASLFSHEGSVGFLRVPPMDEEFMQVLGEAYGEPLPAPCMGGLTVAQALVMKGDPHNVLAERVQLKLFFNVVGLHQPHYAEAYLHLDLPNLRVHFREKDPGYRAGILHAFAFATGPEDGAQAEPS